MSSSHSRPGSRDPNPKQTGCCQLGGCCGCATKPQSTRRRKIRQISEPLRPDELNQVLAQYGLFDEQALPSAWLAPYPLQPGASAGRSMRPFPPATDAGAVGPPTRSISPSGTRTSGPSGSHPVVLHHHHHLPHQTNDSDPEATADRAPGRLDESGQTTSPLAYSLSAELASVGKHRFRLTYVTDRLLVVSYPPDSQETDHNEGARWLCQAFERRYGNNYRIFNLSGFTKELHLSSQVPVIDLFWPVPLAPGLEQLVTAIDQLDYWLHNHDNGYQYGSGQDGTSVDPATNRVAVLHCTGPRSLLATYLAVYICQSKARFGPLCGQRPGSPTARGLQWNEHRFRRFRNELVLGHMILKRFYEDNLARELSPSQKRYVGYFSGLVTGALILQDRLVYLHAVVYRNPAKGRLFGTTVIAGCGLEPIAEANGSGNTSNHDNNQLGPETSIYAHPDEMHSGYPDASYVHPPSTLQLASGFHPTDWSPGQTEHLNVWDWGRLASMDYATAGGDEQAGPSGSAHRVNGIFPTEQERLCDLTSTIEREMRAGRGTDAGAGHDSGGDNEINPTGLSEWSKGIRSFQSFVEGDGGILLKIYQNLKLMHTTRILCPNINICVENFVFPIEPVLPLHGDILIACYLRPDVSTNLQEVIFRLQFHTCATNTEKLSFYKSDLDEACSDNRFPTDGCVELYFSANPELLREHNENIDRGAYTWTSTDKESSILTAAGIVNGHTDYRRLPSLVAGRSHGIRRPVEAAVELGHSVDRHSSHAEEPLSILITTQEFIVPEPSAVFSVDGRAVVPGPMWSEAGVGRRPGERPAPRIPLVRQASDPLSHPTSHRGISVPGPTGVSGQWSGGLAEPSLASLQPGQLPLFQQALLSPRIQTGSKAFDLAGRGAVGGQYQTGANLTAIQTQIGRLNLAQLQQLHQQLLQQYDQLLRQQQQQQQQQQQPTLSVDQTTAPVDSGLYATVQRPNLLTLLNNVQRAIAQQQQQQQQMQRHSVLTPSGPLYQSTYAPAGTPGASLLSGLSSANALSNLARALLPSGPLPVPPTDASSLTNPLGLPRLPTYPTAAAAATQQQPPTGTTLQLTPQGLAYVPTQPPTRLTVPTSLGSLPAVAQPLDPDLERLYLQLLTSRTSTSLQAPSTAQFQNLLRSGDLGTGEPPSETFDAQLLAEQRRRATLQRTRATLGDQERRLFEELRNLRQRRATGGTSGFPRLGTSGPSSFGAATPLESYRRVTGRMPASDTMRSRGRTRMLQSIGRSGSADAARMPYGDLYDVEQSEDAALLALLEQRLARMDARGMLSDTEAMLGDGTDIPLKVVGPQQRSGHVVDGSSQAIMGEFAPDMDRGTGIYSRQPRIHLERSPTATPELGPTRLPYGPPYRARTYSGSPIPHSVHGIPSRNLGGAISPTRRLRPWGYEDQYGRPTDRPPADVSPCISPVPTPSARLLRSPVSPPARPYGRAGPSGLDTGSQSDTGLMGDYSGRGHMSGAWSAHEHPVRRPYRLGRGRTDSGYPRGRGSHDRTFHSPGGVPGPGEGHGLGPLDHVPEPALIALNRLSASTHIWYRPEMSRTQSIDLLRADPPGSFVVRNSGSYPRSFGLVVRVARQQTHGPPDENDLVRHYLVEGLPSSATVMSQAVGVTAASLAPSSVPMGPTALSVIHGAVRLRGCSNEPIFTNLVSLLYEHVVQPLALPCILRFPFKSPTPSSNLPSLIALSRSAHAERLTHHGRPPQPPFGVHHSVDDSPTAGRGRSDMRRGTLMRHPSDPLPAETCMSGTFYSTHTAGPLPPGQYLPSRFPDALEPTRGPMPRGRSPTSAYETEYGPVPAPSAMAASGKWRTFISVYLGTIDTENLTGAGAIRKAVDVLLENASQVKQTEVTIKVSHDGLTVTDNWRKLFFRRHYPFYSVSYCSIDPLQRCWDSQELRAMGFKSARIFGFVARKQNTRENMCHVLCDTPECPASTITEYIMYRLNEY